MLRTVLIVASAVVLLAVGAMTAAAGNAHGKAAATLANSTVLKGNPISTLAKATEAAQRNANDNAVPAATQPKAQTQSSQAETDTDTADEDTDEDADEAGEDANEANVEAAAAAPAAPAAPAAAPAMKAEQEGAEHDD
jgi:hypothetical protein